MRGEIARASGNRSDIDLSVAGDGRQKARRHVVRVDHEPRIEAEAQRRRIGPALGERDARRFQPRLVAGDHALDLRFDFAGGALREAAREIREIRHAEGGIDRHVALPRVQDAAQVVDDRVREHVGGRRAIVLAARFPVRDPLEQPALARARLAGPRRFAISHSSSLRRPRCPIPRVPTSIPNT
ncbi:hypothetical protein DO70_4462 [Burkholderia pseudomallei]|nr:hypothetical protein DO70_4462 [Burkholderia pseudomallei]